jgi:hypothetical protein
MFKYIDLICFLCSFFLVFSEKVKVGFVTQNHEKNEIPVKKYLTVIIVFVILSEHFINCIRPPFEFFFWHYSETKEIYLSLVLFLCLTCKRHTNQAITS